MPLTDQSRILSRLHAGRAVPDALPRLLVEACAADLPVTGVGLVLMGDDGPAALVAASDARARDLEDLEFTLGEGPGLESSRSARALLLPDLTAAAADRWPMYTGAALEAGVRAVFVLPMRIGTCPVGVLALHRDRPGRLDAGDVLTALDYAAAATVVLLHLQARARPDAHGLLSVTVVDDRSDVHLATGMITVQAGVGATQALLLLRARAYAGARTVRSVARDVIARRTTFTAP